MRVRINALVSSGVGVATVRVKEVHVQNTGAGLGGICLKIYQLCLFPTLKIVPIIPKSFTNYSQ